MSPILVDADLLTDAALFTGVAVLLAVVSMVVPRGRRRGMLPMAIIAVVILVALWALGRYGVRLGSGHLYDIAREALLALLAVVVIRSAIVFVVRVVMGRFRLPHILLDVLLVIGVAVYAVYRLYAVGVNLAGIVTTSAVLTGALAFSAGETLRNLWGGLSLQLENTLRIGDWVRVDDRVGQVVSIRWRSMALATPANETIVIPNTLLMKDRVTVLGRTGDVRAPFRREVPFTVDYDHPPAKVIRAITDALRRSEIGNVARTPAPFCVCKAFEDSGIGYSAVYYPLDVGATLYTDSDVLVCVSTALARERMAIPFPRQVVELMRSSRAKAARAEHAARMDALDRTELFHVLIADERAMLAAHLSRCPFAKGDIVFRKGEPADSLYLMTEGGVNVFDEDATGNRVELAKRLAPAYFGEMGLLAGQPRSATVIAADNMLCYRLDKEGFDAILKARPEIADALAQVVAQHQAENDAMLKALDAEARARHAAGGAHELVRRIRMFFGLPADPS